MSKTLTSKIYELYNETLTSFVDDDDEPIFDKETLKELSQEFTNKIAILLVDFIDSKPSTTGHTSTKSTKKRRTPAVYNKEYKAYYNDKTIYVPNLKSVLADKKLTPSNKALLNIPEGDYDNYTALTEVAKEYYDSSLNSGKSFHAWALSGLLHKAGVPRSNCDDD